MDNDACILIINIRLKGSILCCLVDKNYSKDYYLKWFPNQDVFLNLSFFLASCKSIRENICDPKVQILSTTYLHNQFTGCLATTREFGARRLFTVQWVVLVSWQSLRLEALPPLPQFKVWPFREYRLCYYFWRLEDNFQYQGSWFSSPGIWVCT